MNKTERKVIEKLAQSAYAKHLYEGLTIHENYTLPEAIRYWRTAKEDAGAICAELSGYDQNVFLLLEDYWWNVKRLENYIAERIQQVSPYEYRDNYDRITISIAKLPEVFELRAFPGIKMRVASAYTYINDNNEVQIVIERVDNGQHFGKGTLAEITSQLKK